MYFLILLINNFFAEGAPQAKGGIIGLLLPFILIFGIFYFLVIRPQQKQRSKHANFLNEVKKGDEVLTSSGIIGTVSNISDKTSRTVVFSQSDLSSISWLVPTFILSAETVKRSVIAV